MSKAVLLSIKPKYCELIASGKKTVEVRKTRPKIDTPFKCYIYCTKGKENLLKTIDNSFFFDDSYTTNENLYGLYNYLNGTVIGEFVCDEIIEILPDNEIYGIYDISDDEVIASCLVNGDLWNYGKGKTLYGCHISGLVIYDNPKQLYKFYKPCGEHDCFLCDYWDNEEKVCTQPPIKRAPQSWCYVESDV